MTLLVPIQGAFDFHVAHDSILTKIGPLFNQENGHTVDGLNSSCFKLSLYLRQHPCPIAPFRMEHYGALPVSFTHAPIAEFNDQLQRFSVTHFPDNTNQTEDPSWSLLRVDQSRTFVSASRSSRLLNIARRTS